MAGRPPTPVGSHGTINRFQLGENSWEARTYVRDLDGKRRLVSRRGRTGAAAERELKKALIERTTPTRQAISPETRISDVAQRWFADVEAAVGAG